MGMSTKENGQVTCLMETERRSSKLATNTKGTLWKDSDKAMEH